MRLLSLLLALALPACSAAVDTPDAPACVVDGQPMSCSDPGVVSWGLTDDAGVHFQTCAGNAFVCPSGSPCELLGPDREYHDGICQ